VIEQFQMSGLDGSRICFEITETAAIASYSQANRFIHALKELGCRFALDDFGTGLSSFGYLKHFPVDFLKIDGSFVKEILHDPIDREMVRSINEIGHLTGKQTIAEFAENAEIITMLRGIGVDYAQGYGVEKPKRLLHGWSRRRAGVAKNRRRAGAS
jgi:EAL domain-containing protein (putative c-di-GMP-specific phosphodiesterase class I)